MIKHKMTKVVTLLAVVSSLVITSLPVSAGPDYFQLEMSRKLNAAKQKLKQAEAASATQQQNLMKEHMAIMQEIVTKMANTKPRADMTMQEHEEWIAEHQKLMDQVLNQMMEEHHLMMKSCKH
jgi:hypothetical protein